MEKKMTKEKQIEELTQLSNVYRKLHRESMNSWGRTIDAWKFYNKIFIALMVVMFLLGAAWAILFMA